MGKSKFFLAFFTVYVIMEIMNFLFFNYIHSHYGRLNNIAIFRPLSEAGNLLWIGWLLDLVWTFFFVFFYKRLYEGKNYTYGIIYGIYIALFSNVINHFNMFRLIPMPLYMLIDGILFGFFLNITLGVLVSFIYYKNSPGVPDTA